MATELALRVGRRIRQARKAAGLNQRQLAEKIGEPIDGQRVSDWERGVHKPSDRYMAKIAAALGRDEAWFYREVDEADEAPDLLGALGRGDHGQLDRIEAMLIALCEHAGITDDPAEAIRQRLQAEAERHAERPADKPRARGGRARTSRAS